MKRKKEKKEKRVICLLTYTHTLWLSSTQLLAKRTCFVNQARPKTI